MVEEKRIQQMAVAVCMTLFSLGVGAPLAAANAVSVDVDAWQPAFNGSSTIRTNGQPAVNLKNDLGFNEKKGMANLTLKYQNDDNQSLFLNNGDVTFHADQTLRHAISYGGANYLKGDKVNSEVKIDQLHFGFINDKMTAGGKISTIYQYTHGTFKTRLQDYTTQGSRSTENSINCVSLGFGWESVNQGALNYFAEITPLSLGKGAYWDYNYGVKVKLGRDLGLKVGYMGERLQWVKNNDSDLKKAELGGLYVNLSSNF